MASSLLNMSSTQLLLPTVPLNLTPVPSTLPSSSSSSSSLSLDCVEWRQAQHLLYQLSSMCMAVAFLVPNSFVHHVVCLRGLLALGSLFVLIWGASLVCQSDVLAWHLVFLFVNLGQLAYMTYSTWPVPLRPELENLTERTFAPLKVSRTQFRDLVSMAVIKDVPCGGTYALESKTRCGERLSILLSGRLRVTCGGIFLHNIDCNQFIDSPEYEAAMASSLDEDNFFQVSIHATQDSRLLTWPSQTVQQYLRSHPFMNAVFTTMLGKDITHKLYQVQEMLLSNPQYVQVLSSRSSTFHARKHGRPNLNGIPCHAPALETYNYPGCTPPQHRVPTPDGPYSPSQLSFETCV